MRFLSLWLCFTALHVTFQANPARGDDLPLRQAIDAHIRAAWERQEIKPAGPADDAAFLRRVYLDLVGSIPTYAEAVKFIQDKDPQKRSKVIDRLLDDPRFATHQATTWDLILFGRNPRTPLVRNRSGFKQWLTEKFAGNVPYDRWVRDLLLAEQQGTEWFFVQYRNQPEDATVAVSRVFLGTQLQCTRCHDHPFNQWTQRDFYGMAGFFVRLMVVDGGGAKNAKKYFIGEKSSGEVLFAGPSKDQKPGQKGAPVKATFLGGSRLNEPALPKNFKEPQLKTRSSRRPPKPFFSRKAKLAEWVTAPDNPYFAKAVANRIWGQFMGRGLIHPVDDMNGRTRPSHPELFEILARELAANQFDLKWYIRELVNSKTYQLSAGGPDTEALPRWYERARVRPLSAEELMSAIRVATRFDAKAPLPDRIYFLRLFGEPTDGQGRFQGGLAEHLFLNNSSGLWRMIQPAKGNLADALLGSREPLNAKVDQLFLSILNRSPKPSERKRFVDYLTAESQEKNRIPEAIWVLLNCAEFRFNQ